MTPDDEKLFSRVFQQLADVAGEIALRHFRSDIAIESKEDRSPVTLADRAIEQRLREMIADIFPTHGFIGEEFGRHQEHAEFVWVVDPIDGTRAFMTGKPLFGTIIGLMQASKPFMGALEQPFTKERWLGIDGKSATWNGKPIRVAPYRRLDEARLYAGSPHMFAGDDTYLKLCRTARWLQYGCDCYAYGLVAMGHADLVVERHLKIYDVAGLAPIVTGAGGHFADWEGRAVDMNFNGRIIASSSRMLAEEAAAILQG